jgi:hypothetical protein
MNKYFGRRLLSTAGRVTRIRQPGPSKQRGIGRFPSCWLLRSLSCLPLPRRHIFKSRKKIKNRQRETLLVLNGDGGGGDHQAAASVRTLVHAVVRVGLGASGRRGVHGGRPRGGGPAGAAQRQRRRG